MPYNPKSSKSGVGFFDDLPLGEDGKDQFGREIFATDISDRIDNTKSDKAFAIGIAGSWGSGKTSFLDLIVRNLSGDDKIIIKFNPWFSKDRTTIIRDFFNKLSNILGIYSSEAKGTINNYALQLVNLNKSSWFDNITSSIKVKSDSTLEQYYNETNKILKQLNRKIIVIIDDIDRLAKEEVVEVLKLIRNSANFYNTIFLVAYDKHYIIESISEFNNQNKEFFLEKIFQVEFNLPDIDSVVLRRELVKKLETRIPKEYHPQIKGLLNTGSPSDYPFLLDFLHTKRDVTRFCNSFPLVFTLLEDEVNFIDLLNIELIKIKYPIFARILYENSNTFFKSKSSDLDQILLKESDSEDSNYKLEDYLLQNTNRVLVPEEKINWEYRL